ncbi:hypothetical protein B0H10DRAFT_1845558, partial [Mycena sp. CBHHK59/15]
EWLKDEHPDLFDKYYSDGAFSPFSQFVGTLSLEVQMKLEKDMAKKEIKTEVKADVALKKKMVSQVCLLRINASTSVFGLKAFGIDLKKVSKQFSSKFTMGSSVTKNPQGLEEIVVSGDVTDEILEMIESEVGIPADNVKLVEEKKTGGD